MDTSICDVTNRQGLKWFGMANQHLTWWQWFLSRINTEMNMTQQYLYFFKFHCHSAVGAIYSTSNLSSWGQIFWDFKPIRFGEGNTGEPTSHRVQLLLVNLTWRQGGTSCVPSQRVGKQMTLLISHHRLNALLLHCGRSVYSLDFCKINVCGSCWLFNAVFVFLPS